MNLNYQIDHIVYGVEDLDEAIVMFKSKYGMDAIIGGRHLRQGTKNALVNLGDGCYLELLAKDHENKLSESDVWMGMDYLSQPKIIRWALKSKDLIKEQKVSKSYNPSMGGLQDGRRKKVDGTVLKWELLMPLSSPEVELFPFFVDWSKSTTHPTTEMPIGGSLQSIAFFHPNPALILPSIKELGLKMDIQQADQIQIQATIIGPKGIFSL